MKDDVVGITFQHHLLHAVVQDLVGHPAGLFEGQHVAVADRVGVGRRGEADELPAAVAEDHGKAHHLGGLAAKIYGVSGEVHLALFSLFRLEAEVGAAAGPTANRVHVLLQHAVTALVPEGPNLAQDAGGGQVFLDHQLLDQGLESIELRGAPLAGLRSLSEAAHRFDIDAQPVGNRLVAISLGEQAADLLVAVGAFLRFQLLRGVAEPSASIKRQSDDLVDSRSPARINRSSSAGPGLSICRVRGATPCRRRR